MRCHLTENCARRCSWCRWSVWLESASVVGSPEARRRGWRRSVQWTYALRFFSSICWSMMSIESPLLCFLDVRQRPGFVEDRLVWSVKTEERFKTLAGFGGNPVRVLALRRTGSEIDIGGAVRV